MDHPLISIITPTYNHEKFIGPCIESVLAQTYSNWEMIIVDDGSTDKTSSIIASYRDPRIRYFRQKNQGIWKLGQTYNFALQQTQGEFIAILEGDDAWPHDRLGRQIPYFSEPDVVLVFGQLYIINEDECILGPRRDLPGDSSVLMNKPPGRALKQLFVSTYVHAITTLIKREPLIKIGGFKQPTGFPAVDASTWLHIALEGEFRFVDAPMGYWRVHSNQATATMRLNQCKGFAPYAKLFFRSLETGKKELTEWDESSLERALNKKVARAYFEAGRHQLLSGECGSARSSFIQAIKGPGITTRFISLIAIFSSLTGLKLESIIKFIGRTPLD